MLANDTLTEPERHILQAADTGVLIDLSKGESDIDVARGNGWGADRTVRATLLAELLTGARRPNNGSLRTLKIRGARIIGTLDLEAATLIAPLFLQDCCIEQPINLREATAPSISLPGCHIPGMAAGLLHTRGSLALDNGFTARGKVYLVGAQIGGTVSLQGASLSNPGGEALVAVRLTVSGSMFCKRLATEGAIALFDASIAGSLVLNAATLTNPGGSVLIASRLTVGGGMYCDHITTRGEINLVGAHLGELTFEGANLANPGGHTLLVARLTVDQAMFCRAGFTSHGEVNMWNAHIGILDFAQATLTNPEGMALDADGITVNRMACQTGFTARGQVNLAGARIGSELDCRGARFANPDDLALDLQRMTTPALYLLPEEPPDGIVNLDNARVGNFDDNPASWPKKLRLRGFVYDALDNDTVNVRDRLRWLRLDPDGYRPQPYDQLATTYERVGDDDAARQVKITKQWRRRGETHPLGKLWNWLLYLTVGYGYRTWLAAIWLAVLLALGSGIFAYAYPDHMTATSARPPAFQPVAYTLDVLLPIVDLGQQKAWTPQGSALYWMWALIAIGWILTTAVVAGLTRVLKRD
jgi:hypothetical protein